MDHHRKCAAWNGGDCDCAEYVARDRERGLVAELVTPEARVNIEHNALEDIAAALRYADVKVRTINGEKRHALTLKTLSRIRCALRAAGMDV